MPSEEVFSINTIAAYKDGIIFTDPKKHRIMSWSFGSDMELFAGDFNRPGNQDGPSMSCQFYQPTGVCVEFNHVVYVCDSQTGCIKIFSTLVHTSQLLGAIGKLYTAFSVHEKHQSYKQCSLDEAILLVESCLTVLRGNETMIRNSCDKAPKSLNGPEGNVATKTVDSVALMKWGLERLRHNISPWNYTATNLLSCMTLDVENIHAVVHFKEPLYFVLQFSRNFGKALKEALKRTTNWSAVYYTNPKSWYPVPGRATRFIDIPDIKPLPVGHATADEIRFMRDWAQSYGAAVRQRTVRVKTRNNNGKSGNFTCVRVWKHA
jgi:hypothetical protein